MVGVSTEESLLGLVSMREQYTTYSAEGIQYDILSTHPKKKPKLDGVIIDFSWIAKNLRVIIDSKLTKNAKDRV